MNLKGSIGNFGVDYLFVLMNSGTCFYIKTKMSRMMNDTTFSMFWGSGNMMLMLLSVAPCSKQVNKQCESHP